MPNARMRKKQAKQKALSLISFCENVTMPNGLPVQLCPWQKDFIKRFEQAKKHSLSGVYFVNGRICGISSMSRILRHNTNNLPRTEI